MKTTGIVTALALVLAATAAPASPAKKSAAEAAYADGQKKYAAADYLGAAQRFKEAFELDPDPVYLFNAAQAFRFGTSCAAAAEHYKRFLAAAPTAPNRAKVEKYIDEMTACAKREAPPPAPVVTPPEPPPVTTPVIATPGDGGASLPPSTEPAMPRDTAASSSHDGGSLRWIGVGVGAAGVIGLGIGLVEHAKVRSAAADREALASRKQASGEPWTADDQALADRLDHKGNRASSFAIASYALGGAALAAGITMYVLGSRSREPAHVAVIPRTGGALVTGAFTF